MKLGIFGDSYADINCPDIQYHGEHSKPWPIILESMMGASAEFFARSGTSTWYSYQHFIKNYKKFDYIVFCYSEFTRWSAVPDNFYTLSSVRFEEQLPWLESRFDKSYIDMSRKLIAAHPILFSEEFSSFVYQSIFDKVNKTCRENNIKLINLMPFDNCYSKIPIDISNRMGSCITGIQKIGIDEGNYPELSNGGDLRYCHLNPSNNKLLAKTIYELWDTNTEVKFK